MKKLAEFTVALLDEDSCNCRMNGNIRWSSGFKKDHEILCLLVDVILYNRDADTLMW